MGECQLWIRRDFGPQQIILDIGPNDPAFATADEADPGSIINGGSGVLVIKEEGKR